MAKIICVLFALLFIGCARKPQEAIKEMDFYNMPKNYKPKYAIDYIDSMKQKESYEKSRFYYDKEGNAVAEIIFINTKDSRKQRTTKQTWKENESSIGNDEIKYTLTKKQKDIADYRIEQRRKDATFTEIEKIVLQVALEHDYNFEEAYNTQVKYRNPNIKKAVCDGYANAVIEAFENHPLVEKVEKWSSNINKHAWNVIILKDGRKIYCDATWYDGNKIDNEGYVINIPKQNPVNLTFDIEEFNSNGGAIDNATNEILKVHFAWKDAKLVN